MKHVSTTLLLVALIILTASALEINTTTAKFEEITTVELNALTQVVLLYPNTTATNPHTLRAWSTDAKPELPVLVVIRQSKQVSSWTIPEAIETTRKDKTLLFRNTSKTLCHDDMDSIVQDALPFPIDPLVLSQSFIVALSSSSPSNVTVNVLLEEEKDFFMTKNVNYTLMISPSQSRYKFFKFTKNTSDTVVIEIESPDDICLTISVQDSKCPVMDSNKDVTYEGTYQTINKKGAITIAKKKYPTGFFLVFVAKSDDYDCSAENSIIPMMRATITENTIVSTVTFVVRESINLEDYITACLVTMGAIVAFGTIITGIVFIFNRFGTISKTTMTGDGIHDHIRVFSNEEIQRIISTQNLTVDVLAKNPKRIKQRAFNYFSHTSSIALFYSIPVIQLVVTYQRVVNQTGNQDVCYYNFMCAHPAWGLSDFNHIFSNIGYILIGIFFIFAVLDRQYRIKITKDIGIPVHYGLYYAMGLALVIEGILSACYHICPSQSNYQFDTSFMYVMAVLIMIKLYQNRHPDINATAYTTFTIVGLAIFIAMVGILDGALFIWVVFLILYILLIVILSLKIYYLNFVMHGIKRLYVNLKTNGMSMRMLRPIKKARFTVICIANAANLAILGGGLYIYTYHLTDFGTFLLGLLMANTLLHVSFYTMMKVIYKERISVESIIFGFLGLCFWISSGIFFLDAATLWTVTPAESRQWNQGCIWMQFYDKHDIWHLLSAGALYFTFLYLMYLDDDLCDQPQNSIPVF